MPYSVHLRDSGFAEEFRTTAEARYRSRLEKLLGGEDGVLRTYQRWNALIESDETPSETDRAFNKQWESAVRESIAAGFKGQSLPEGFEGYFEIRVAR